MLDIVLARSCGVKSPTLHTQNPTPPREPSPRMAGGVKSVIFAAWRSAVRFSISLMTDSICSSGDLRWSQCFRRMSEPP